VSGDDAQCGESLARGIFRFHLGANGLPNYNAQVLVFFIITVAAAEVAVGLAIIVALFRARQTTHVEDISTLKF
jgi:NADH-quinone oxidoreductase subunit K